MRDPEDLLVFRKADEVVVLVYAWTVKMPVEERYGLTSQIRRAAVSVPSNLVEGCSRQSQADFRRFVEIALGSSMELRYQLGLACRCLGMEADTLLMMRVDELTKTLIRFNKALRGSDL